MLHEIFPTMLQVKFTAHGVYLVEEMLRQRLKRGRTIQQCSNLFDKQLQARPYGVA